MMHLKLLEKQEQTKPQTSRRREIIKIRAEINEMETKQTVQRISETKHWFFEKISKIDKPLANMTKRRQKNTQIHKIRDEKGDRTTYSSEIQ
jgi:hemerythrin